MTGTRANDPGSQIASSALIGPDVKLGRGLLIREGAIVSGRCRISDDCILESGVVISGATDAEGELVLEQSVLIQAGAIVEGAVTIGRYARVQAGAVVQRSVPPFAIVSGNPAEIIGYTLSSDPDRPSTLIANGEDTPEIRQSRVKGVSIHKFAKILDLRGNLTVGEFGRNVPFEPKRYFMVFGVPNAEVRGEHAHHLCHQFLICAHGSCHVVADDGHNREEFILDDPSVGLYLPPLTWGIQYKYSADAILLVFASHYYDSEEYIRNYDDFSRLATAVN